MLNRPNLSTDLGFPVGAKLIELIREHGLHQFPEGPEQMNPFQYTFGMSIFDYFQHDAEQKEAFDNYMTIRRPVDAPQWFETYPADQEILSESLKQDKDAVLVCDVGGGHGHEAIKFQEWFPNLPGRLVVQDLPETVRKISPKPEGIEFMEHDFFKEQPVRGEY